MTTTEASATPRVYLHVGVPKTGTTFVQDVLWRGRSQLSRDGVCYPLRRRTEGFAAAMDLRGASWGGGRNPDWDGTWDRLARTVIESGAPRSVISGELLAAADATAVARAMASFPDHEVHVVLTVRDLARQLVSGWQEHVKHRVSVPLESFVAGCLGDGAAAEREQRFAGSFWRLHDGAAVATRWGGGLPPEQLHLVTVPPAGRAGRGELWERFAAVTGIDPVIGHVDTARPNTSLGVAEAELLRRYNASRVGELSQLHYDQVVRVLLAEKVLAGGDGPPLRLPAQFADAVHQRSTQLTAALAAAGYDVVGDLDDLVPDLAALRTAPVNVVSADQLVTAAVRATAGLIAELGPLQRRLRSRSRLDRPGPDAGAPAQQDGRLPGGSGEPGAAPGPVYVHVGAPKTGTTFLQNVMWHHRQVLAAAGVRFTRRRYGDHFLANLDLREVSGRAGASAGMWARVASDTLDWSGPSVISHELLAAARPEHVARALASLGPDRVHIVYTVRDLWGLLGAEWQESTKHGRALSFEQYLHDVLERGRDGVVGRWFWSVHDPVDVLARWGRDLPPERVHLVTVPPAGAERGLLWQRFAAVVGVDPTVVPDTHLDNGPDVDTTVDPAASGGDDDAADHAVRANSSLGAEEVTFLRHVNERLGGRHDGVLTPGEHSQYVKSLLAEEILSRRSDKTRFAPPPTYFPLVQEWAERQVAGLRQAGYDVVGDLDDLVPSQPVDGGSDPDRVAAELLVDVGLDALAGLVRRAVRLREAYGFGVEAAPSSRWHGGEPSSEPPGRLRQARSVLGQLRRRINRRARP